MSTLPKLFPCPMCSKALKSSGSLHNHLATHTKEKPHKCPTCSAVFGHLAHLKTHKSSVHEGVKRISYPEKHEFQCPQCSHKCSNRTRLKVHLRKHSAERPISCNVTGCEYKTKYKSALKQHVQVVHNGQPRHYECTSEGCSYKTLYLSNLTTHLKVHSNEKSFVCKVPGCSYSTKTKYCMKMHTSRMHEVEKPFKCSTCSFEAVDKSSLQRHEDQHDNIKRFHCQVTKCNFATHVKKYLKTHVANKHSEKLILCTEKGCNFRCGSNVLLNAHVRRAHRLPILKCPVDSCILTTRSLQHLRRHVSSQHTGLQTASLFTKGQPDFQNIEQADSKEILICPLASCDFQTEFKHRYDRHLKTHDEEAKRKFVCKFCSCRFETLSNLQLHIQRHIGEKPYRCQYCNYSSVDGAALRWHARRVHYIHVISRRKENQLMRRCHTCNLKSGSYTEFVLHSLSHLNAVVVLERLKLHFM